MDIRKLQRAIVDGLEDVKAQDILVFNTEHLSALFERVIVATGTSNRQTKALAASVRDAVKGRGMEVLRTEGEDNGEWIIVDCGAAVVHIMQPAIREYYHLEEIWGEKAIHLKSSGVKPSTRLVKASEDGFASVKAASKKVVAGAKTAARKAPARKSPAIKTPTRKTPAGKAPARKTPVRKTAGRPTGKTLARKPG
jgi:ribosome-associated protein